MTTPMHKAVAIVGVGAVMPDAPDLPTFWSNIKNGVYSITDVPADRWNKSLYYNADRKAPDKAYSTIGGWVKDLPWDPLKWRMPIPPKVADLMDLTQKYAITATREALLDFDYENKDFDRERVAVIFGNAMGGDQHLYSAARALFPEFAESLKKTGGFQSLPQDVKRSIITEMNAQLPPEFVPITEDTMPGELSNIAAGRIAALFNFRGMNYVTDAACASALAGVSAAVNGLLAHDYDLVVTGGTDANMSPSTFIKFCKIGALSARDSRPYAEGADGFVMGEGTAVFVMKRLEDAERDGDKIYAVFRSIGGSSDGKGKGITAPNPIGQILAVKNAWKRVGLSPASAGLIEGHGTSTTVGDAAELNSMVKVYEEFNLPVGSIALGSVKGNIGHLKGGAGAAGMMKATMALYDKVLPPSLNFHSPNPNVDFTKVPFKVNTELRPWDLNGQDVRRAGVSAFGFGGTNFHVVMEEYIPGKLTSEEKKMHFVSTTPESQEKDLKKPLRGTFVTGAENLTGLISKLEDTESRVKGGWTPDIEIPLKKDLDAQERIAIDFADNTELQDKLARLIKALKSGKNNMWKVLNAKGIFYGKGRPGKSAFLFTGQGSQYVNMLKKLSETEPIVAATFAEADKVMTPLLGRSLTSYIFIDDNSKEKVAEAENALKQTEITQPAMLCADVALYRLACAYGMKPDMVTGHSLGEYGALVASGALSFKDALLAVSARGHQMAKVKVEDTGKMAAIFTSPEKINEVLDKIDGYVVIANINSYGQSVIGGASKAVEEAMKASKEAGYHVAELPVSHAFHTSIVAPASGPLRSVLDDFDLKKPAIPIISNVTGEFYPTAKWTKTEMLDLLSKQVASPVQFVKGINNLYDQGARIFVEMGPKKALNGFVRDILSEKEDVANLFTNHPKVGDLESFNQALCGMYAAGLGIGREEENISETEEAKTPPAVATRAETLPIHIQKVNAPQSPPSISNKEVKYLELGKMFVDFLEKADTKFHGGEGIARKDIWITGAAMGLPGVEKVFSDDNVKRILRGDQFIQLIPQKIQEAMLTKNITRLQKTGKGGPRFVTIDKVDEVIKLAARKLDMDIVRDFDFPKARMEALDVVSALAIGAGIDALRDAGIPLVMNYKTTSTGSKLPDRWLLPKSMRDDTGVIFASAFPGYNQFSDHLTSYYENRIYLEKLETLKDIRSRLSLVNGTATITQQIDQQMNDLQRHLDENPYVFDRKFLFQVLSMGHSQFAEYIGARGPNTQVNAACASTTQAVGMAKDWINEGRCNRVLVIAGDDITDENTLEWFASGFLATGAAATDDKVENAALPFDKRRHGMLIGMGGASLVVESKEVAQERGIAPIAEVLSSVIANSAFHGTRLDVSHIKHVMEKLITNAEKDFGINRNEIAASTVFISHETYTPARGGSAAAEIDALKHVFGDKANDVVIANTKGFTGHPMGVGIEDVIAIKILETGMVPPIPNFKEVDPELGNLNLSKGGKYPVTYALRLAAGFGSQISMTLYRWYPTPDRQHASPDNLGFTYRIVDHQKHHAWLKSITGKDDPEIEVYKRTLRIKDEFASVSSTEEPVTIQQPTSSLKVEKTEEKVAASPQVSSVDPIGEEIMALIAEKTGYPTDMLDPDLDLEADLGIDTVKQAELFAEVRGKYDIPADESRVLSDFPTLKHIIDFVHSNRPDLAAINIEPVPQVSSTPTTEEVPSGITSKVEQEIMALIAEKTGYPPEMLDPDLDLEADLGIDTVKQAELFADIRGLYGIERDDTIELSAFPTLKHIMDFVYDKKPALKDQVTPQPVQAASAAHAAVTTTISVPESEVSGGVQDEIMSLIAEKTGYPPEMLELDLDLEADLGIDTVKQAELFADIRGLYGIERDDTIELSAFPTLKHIINFVYDKRPELRSQVTTPLVQKTPAVKTEVIPTASAPANETSGGVQDEILALIAEKTGYPPEMLELDLDLEADLGIDTVKQAELFADIRGLYDIERDDSIDLSAFPTLKHIIEFVYAKRPDLKTGSISTSPATKPTPQVPTPPKEVTTPSGDDKVVKEVLGIIAEKTGYPPEMLELDLDLEADLGIDTVKQAELFADIRGLYDIERDDTLDLSEFPTLQHIIDFVYSKRGDLQTTKILEATAQELTVVEKTSSDSSYVVETILSLVAEKTGYPPEMLELDLDLEADLGIDTVKQAELFGDVRALFGIAFDESRSLSDYPTLNHIVQFVNENRSTDSIDSPVAENKADAPAIKTTLMKGDWDAISTIPRRIPTPILRPDLDLCKSTGIELDGARIIVKSDSGKIGEALVKLLKKSGAEALIIQGQLQTDELEVKVKTWVQNGKIDGVYWLPTLDVVKDLTKLNYKDWKHLTYETVKMLYLTMHQLELLDQKPFLISSTRLGGQFGYDDQGAVSPIGGAVAGFTKAYKRENPDSLVKVIDFEVSRKTKAFAELIIDETLKDNGAVEIGYKADRRWTIGFKEEFQLEGEEGMKLDDQSVYLITGGAGSITSAITADLALANGGTYHILDLTPEPDRNNQDILQFDTDKEGLKRTLFERLKTSGEKATPVMVEKLLSGIERKHAALSAITAIENAGGKVHYHSVNLLDHKAVSKVIKKIMKAEEKIDVFLHAGGLEISRMLKDKSPDEFNLVFDVKSDGWYNIMSTLDDFPIGAVVVFSSIAGRFGNGGQVDYSAANDFLCKSTSNFKSSRTSTRGIALDWTAWGGIGMAARGSIPMVMKQAGIDMLPPEAGIPFIRKELTAGTGSKEVIVAQSLGMMLHEFDPTGGMDVKIASEKLLDDQVMIQDIKEMGIYSGYTVSATFDPKEQGFLFDHQINEVPVLPGVMGIEAMTSAAQSFVPDMNISQVEHVQFFAPFKFYKSEPREVFVSVQFRMEEGLLVADCELYGMRKLLGQEEAQRTKHFVAKVVFGDLPDPDKKVEKKWLKKSKNCYVLKKEDIYQVYFHGPTYQVLGEVWQKKPYLIAKYNDKIPANHQPKSKLTLVMPRLIEHCFQTAGVQQLGSEGIMGLPARVGKYVKYKDWDGKKKMYSLVEFTGQGYQAKVVGTEGDVYIEVDGYYTAEFPSSMDVELLKPLQEVVKN